MHQLMGILRGWGCREFGLWASSYGGWIGALLASVRALPAAGSPPDLAAPEALHQALLALALRDESVDGAQAVELADRALELVRADQALDPPAALEAAKQAGG